MAITGFRYTCLLADIAGWKWRMKSIPWVTDNNEIYWQSSYCGDIIILCLNIWCNNYRELFFLGIFFCNFDFSLLFTKNPCFLCAPFGNVTTFCLLQPKKTMQNPLWERKVCPKLINVIMENNWSHKSGSNSTLYNITMKCLPLSPHILIWNCPVFFLWQKNIFKFHTFSRFHQWAC